MRSMHDPIQDRIGQGRIGQPLVPRFDRQLAGDQRRFGAHAVIEQFEQVVTLGRGDGRNRKVVQCQ